MTNPEEGRKWFSRSVAYMTNICSWGTCFTIVPVLVCVTKIIFINSSVYGKIVFLRKLKLIYPCNSQHQNNGSAPTFSILFKKIVNPTRIQKRRQRLCILDERLKRNDRGDTILYGGFLIYRTVTHNIWRKLKNCIKPKLPSHYLLTQIYYNMNFITRFSWHFVINLFDCFWKTFL